MLPLLELSAYTAGSAYIADYCSVAFGDCVIYSKSRLGIIDLAVRKDALVSLHAYDLGDNSRLAEFLLYVDNSALERHGKLVLRTTR